MRRDRAILVVHDDPAVLDQLTRLFEARGCVVFVAPTRMFAVARIESRPEGEEFDVVVAGWDVGGATGPRLYRWVLENRYHLRGRFVFLARDVPEGFVELVHDRCVWVSPDAPDDLAHAVEAAARRVEQVRSLDDGELEWFHDDTPRMLIADDEPLHLSFIARMFREAGFKVATADSGNTAITMLVEQGPYDVILVNWFMSDGTGAEVHDFLRENLPDLVPRCIFLSGLVGSDLDAIRKKVPQCSVFPKGQDSQALVRAVTAVINARPS